MREGQKTETAKTLRRDMTDAERAMWARLRNRQFHDLKFRRQVPIGPFIADFLCHERHLIVEIDGGHHEPGKDAERTAFLEREGFHVLRFWNNDVLSNIEGVLERLSEFCIPQTLLTLPYTARYLRRRALTADDGTRIVIDLPEARILKDGEIVEAADGTRVTIRAAEEDLLEITGAALPRIAWHVGNRHTPCQVEDTRLLIQRDHVLRDMLERLGAVVRDVYEPFEPEGGAYGHGRTHGHSHSHDPQADPNAHLHDHD